MCTGFAYCTGDMQKLPAPFCLAFDLISCEERHEGAVGTWKELWLQFGRESVDALVPESGAALALAVVARPLGPFDWEHGKRWKSEEREAVVAFIHARTCLPAVQH